MIKSKVKRKHGINPGTMNILVIDAGTSSMRVSLYNDLGEKLIEKSSLYNVNYIDNMTVEMNPDVLKKTLIRLVRNAVKEAKRRQLEIHAVTLTSQRSSVMPVDAKMQPLYPFIMWQDRRSNATCERLSDYHEFVFERCGSRINPVFSAAKMTWIKENLPDLYESVAKFMVIPDYLTYLMTAEVVTDTTYGSRSLLMNIRSLDYDDDLLKLFDVKREHLCDLVPPGSMTGTIHSSFSALTGLEEGLPFISAGGDQQCGAIGQGVVKAGTLSINCGTGAYLTCAIDHVPDHLTSEVIINAGSLPNSYILEYNVLSCCSAFDWFRKEFYPDYSYDELTMELMSSISGSNGVRCLPYFQGRSTPDYNNQISGIFTGLSLGVHRADLLRSLLEGICFEIKNGIDIMSRYVPIEEVHINGGLTNNAFFNQLLSDVIGREVIHFGDDDATSLGALIVALNRLPQESPEELTRQILSQRSTAVYTPDMLKHKFYATCIDDMNRLYQKMK